MKISELNFGAITKKFHQTLLPAPVSPSFPVFETFEWQTFGGEKQLWSSKKYSISRYKDNIRYFFFFLEVTVVGKCPYSAPSFWCVIPFSLAFKVRAYVVLS